MPIVHRELLDGAAALVRYEAPVLVVPVALALWLTGAVGVAIGLAGPGERYLKDSWLFPVALTLVGLAVVGFGLWWNRNEARLSSRLQSSLPAWLREAIAGRRSVL